MTLLKTKSFDEKDIKSATMTQLHNHQLALITKTKYLYKTPSDARKV